ncbi:MAG: hypothetical protein AB4426_25280 [Xenococcaceae cyanobacterium]
MKIKSQFSSFAAKITLSLSVGAALGIMSSFGQSTLAQSTNPQESDGYQSSEYDSLSGTSTFGNSFNPIDLIHRANLGPGRSAADFSSDLDRNINEAAAEFKRLQQERLLNQQSESSNNSSAGEN